MDPVVPMLRNDLQWKDDQPDSPHVTLIDRALNRSLKVDRRGFVIASLLDCEQTKEELLKRIAQQYPPMEPDALLRVLQTFEGLGLLQTSLVEEAAQSRHAMEELYRTNPEAVPLIIPHDLRFSCMACGSCCTGVNIGPISETIAGQPFMQELEKSRPFKSSIFFSMFSEETQETSIICESRNGSCIFMQDDKLCEIHARHGLMAKGEVCRRFPYQFILSPDGVHIGLQMECRDILRASQGELLTQQEDSLRAILKEIPRLPATHAFVSIDGEKTLSWSDYLSLEKQVLTIIQEEKRTGFDLLTVIWERVQELLGCEFLPRTDVIGSFYALLQDIGNDLVLIKKRNLLKTEEKMRFHTANLDLLIETFTDIPLYADRILTSPEEDQSDRFFRLLLRNAWESKAIVGASTLLAGIANLYWHWFLTRAVAVSRARQVQRVFVCAQDIVDASVAMELLTRNHQIKRMLAYHTENIQQTMLYDLPYLLEHRLQVVQIDPRTDFYLF